MASIDESSRTMCEFLKKTLLVEDVKAVKITKTPDGWEGEVEVYEESSFIKSIGLSTKVQDCNIYKIRLDENLDIQSYERKNGRQSQE